LTCEVLSEAFWPFHVPTSREFQIAEAWALKATSPHEKTSCESRLIPAPYPPIATILPYHGIRVILETLDVLAHLPNHANRFILNT
jgi:hypothetical protein